MNEYSYQANRRRRAKKLQRELVAALSWALLLFGIYMMLPREQRFDELTAKQKAEIVARWSGR